MSGPFHWQRCFRNGQDGSGRLPRRRHFDRTPAENKGFHSNCRELDDKARFLRFARSASFGLPVF